MLYEVLQLQLREQGGTVLSRWQRQAVNLRTEVAQCERQPCPLKSRVPGYQHTFTSPEIPFHSQSFHAAFPAAHCSSRKFLSRSVSIGCQKPWCSNARI